MSDQNAVTAAPLSTPAAPAQAATVAPLGASPASRFAWILNSRKAQTALASVVTILLARLLAKLGFSAADITEVTASVAVLGTALIAGIAHEDANRPAAQPQPSTPEISAEKNALSAASPGSVAP